MALGITCLRSGHRRLGENRGEAVECLLECVLGLDPAPPSPGCVTLGKTRTNLCFSSHICEGSQVIQAPSWVVVRINWVTLFTCFEQLQALSAFLVLEVGKPTWFFGGGAFSASWMLLPQQRLHGRGALADQHCTGLCWALSRGWE